MKYAFQIYGSSDIGLKRAKNEDVWVSLPDYRFFALADGMGGHNAGEIAAKQTIQSLSESIQYRFHSRWTRHSVYAIKQELLSSIQEANNRVFHLGKDHSAFKGMGTTVCCLYLYKHQAIFAHVGDSRIYLYRDQHLKKLTDDHSLIKGANLDIPSPYKHVITRAIGIQKQVEPEINDVKFQTNDLFFLCSDGLTDFLKEEEINQILKEELSLKTTVKKLIHRAKENGSHDNITVLMLKIYG